MKRIIKIILIILAVIILAAALLIGFLSIREYKPEDQEVVEISGDAAEAPEVGDTIKVVTWNVGYGALGDNADFFMDGGSSVQTADEARVNENLSAVSSVIDEINPDVLFLQELDRNSARSHHIDELEVLSGIDALAETDQSFAYNFKVDFIPYPIPPIGKVESGIATFSKYSVDSAERVQLPIPFSWPVRMANLKRCLLINRVPLEDGHELVLVNLHLEAYDDGEGKAAQTQMLREILETEAAAGNYVIAGGDFNQTFSNADASMYPELEGTWHCGRIDVNEFDESLQFLMDNSVPTGRSLDQAYEGADQENFQYYLIDGFIVSDNLNVNSVETVDLGFEASDHNPVVIEVELK